MPTGPFEILIVEDSKTQRVGLRLILEDAGYLTREAEDGVEALALLEERPSDLVISDIVMPNMDGYDFCRAAKEHWPRMPIILLTSLKEAGDIVRGLECGADNYLPKPYDREHLLSRVEFMRVNLQLRNGDPAQAGVEIFFAGKRRFLTSSRLQILDHLLASYEDSVRQTSALRDANDRLREMQLALERKNDQLARRNEQLAALNETKNQLIGTVSHDLRNPLGVLRSYAQLIRAGRIAEERVPVTLQRIEERADFMLKMVDNLLDLSAIESGKVSLALDWIQLCPFVDEVVERNRLLAEGKGVILEFEAQPGEDRTLVLMDTTRFEQVLNNLISNAVRFSPEAGTVTIAVDDADGGWILSVSDTGPGVRPEEASRLFKPYERGTTVAPGKSTGLGLAIVRRIVTDHGGRIWVEPSDAGGARFCVFLPETSPAQRDSDASRIPNGDAH